MSRRGRLLIVDPSVAWPETEGVAVLVGLWPGASTVWTPVLDPASAPAGRDVRAFDAVVLLGSRASVHDPDPWRAAVDERLAPVVAGDVPRPFLGVCYGHQWLVHLAGGSVAPARPDGAKIVGIEETEIVGGRLLERGRRLRVVASHREAVTAVPDGFRTIARRASCAVDGVEHEARPLFGVQFHPEARGDFARAAGIAAAAIDERVRADAVDLIAAFFAVAAAPR